MAGLSWADLPDDLLFLLANRVVGVATFIRFSAVCKSWCSVASPSKCYKPAPWLMLSEKDGSDLRDFYDHSTGELYQFQLSQAQGMKIVGSAHGWIITAGKDASFHLLNPVSGTHITLPPQTAFPSVHLGDFGLSPEEMRGLFMIKAACSSIEPNGDCIVAATHIGDDNLVLSFCRSTDTEWTTFEVLALKEVGFVGGDFYAVSAFGDLYICNFSSPPELIEIADLRAFGDFFGCDFYIVGCANEILVVVKLYGCTEEEISYTTRFRVFKLDVGSKKMVEVKSIGGYSLFLGVNNSICLPVTSDDKLFKRNSIYFTDDRQEEIFAGDIEGGDDMGVFNLEDGSISTYYSNVSKSFYSLPTWVTVNPLRLSDHCRSFELSMNRHWLCFHETTLWIGKLSKTTNGNVSSITVVSFPNYYLLMMHSVYDGGNGFTSEALEAERLFSFSKENNARDDVGYDQEDLVVAVVGSQFLYSGLWVEHTIVLQSLLPLLSKSPSDTLSNSHFKVGILSGNATSAYKVALEVIALNLGFPQGSVRQIGVDGDLAAFYRQPILWYMDHFSKSNIFLQF